jgi:hypothetical protein
MWHPPKTKMQMVLLATNMQNILNVASNVPSTGPQVISRAIGLSSKAALAGNTTLIPANEPI